MSKAFTKEDDDAAPPANPQLALPTGPFRLTATGAKLASAATDPRVLEALTRAEILEPARSPSHAALGVTVKVLTDAEERKTYRLVSHEERVLVGDGCSIDGPVGRALLGAKVGDVREVSLPRGVEELTIVALVGEAD